MTDEVTTTAVRPTVECIICLRQYDRQRTDQYRPLGVFENYCLCEDCLQKDKVGWK